MFFLITLNSWRIAEVRTILEKYSEQQLRLIIAEMYKAIPKAIKEDKDIDGILTNPEALAPSKARKKKQPTRPDIKTLQEETEQFIDYAYQQYYFAPNTIVPKRQRPKWRFIAKRLYKALLAAAARQEFLPLASDLLTQLYVMLCYSCRYTIFTAYDSFQSVGIEQTTFLHSVLTLKVKALPRNEFVKQAIVLVVNNGVNRYTLYTDLMEVVLAFLTTPDVKECAIQTCDALLQQVKATVKPTRHGYVQYEQKEKMNNFVEMVFLCCGQLYEFERGIQYFLQNYSEKTPEVTLYILLHFLWSFQQPALFVQEYENAVKRGIRPRETLVNLYESIQATGEVPEHFY